MQAVCAVLEQLLCEGVLRYYATSLETEAVEQAMVVDWENHRLRVMRPEHLAATALTVGRPKDRARLVYLAELPDFDHARFAGILSRHELHDRWHNWVTALGLCQSTASP